MTRKQFVERRLVVNCAICTTAMVLDDVVTESRPFLCRSCDAARIAHVPLMPPSVWVKFIERQREPKRAPSPEVNTSALPFRKRLLLAAFRVYRTLRGIE